VKNAVYNAIGPLTLAILFTSCTPGGGETTDFSARAESIARTSIIIDTHVDLPYRLDDVWEDVSGATEFGNLTTPVRWLVG